MRYDEDYSYLRDPAKRTGAWWEPFKYIPLDLNGGAYLTLGLELRFREEAYGNFNWGQLPVNEYQWYRMLPYADLHLGSNLRLFGQLIGTWVTDKDTVGGIDQTGFEPLQAFADLKLPLAEGADLTLRGGRQLLSYGTERLISLRYGPNVLRSFDAALASVQTAPWRVDAFYAQPVRNLVGSFNDRFDHDRSVWSIYATRQLPDISAKSGFDLYYIGYRNAAAEYNQGRGEEVRHTIGSRLFGAAQGWDWNFEGMAQFGHFAHGNIRAWSVASDTGYTFADVTFSPRLGLRANIISGDQNPNEADLQTFNPLFPKGKYFGEIGLIGPYNLINAHPTLTLQLDQHWTLDLATVFYWRESLGDGVYGAGGDLVRPSGNSRARYIGTQADVILGWQPVPWFSAAFSYSAFVPGPFIQETGWGETAHFVGLEAMLKF
ncbi:alginate export family protein [Bradyrhizobium sp. Leo121]|nr:alginate export family protein [Bradyrhizobium sp. Leo121]